MTIEIFSEENRLLGNANIGETYRGVLLDGSLVVVKML